MARRVAQASLLRRVADELATRPVDADEWAPVAAALTALLDPAGGPREPGEPVAGTMYAREVRSVGPDRERMSRVAHRIGEGASPVFPPLRFSDGALGMAVTFGAAFEGPPGLVHGGFLAAAFDVHASAATFGVLPTAVTRRLAVRFYRPVPLDTELHFRAQLHQVDARRMAVRSDVRDPAGRRLASAEAECVGLDSDRFAHRFADGDASSET